MRSKQSPFRTFISLFVAVVFAISVTPGAMAMPASHAMNMDCSSMAAPSCDHMKADKEQGKPCKNMALCFGMLGCYGMAALDIAHVAPLPPTADAPVAIAVQHVSGLTLQPDNPPPIA